MNKGEDANKLEVELAKSLAAVSHAAVPIGVSAAALQSAQSDLGRLEVLH